MDVVIVGTVAELVVSSNNLQTYTSMKTSEPTVEVSVVDELKLGSEGCEKSLEVSSFLFVSFCLGLCFSFPLIIFCFQYFFRYLHFEVPF
jgi:hypothetical protein